MAPRGKQSTATRSVRFLNSVRIRFALHVTDYTKEEIQECFYNSSELCEFKDDAKRTAQMMDKKQIIDDDVDICRRGAEHLTEEAKNVRYHRRNAAATAVFGEPFWQDGSLWNDTVAARYADAVRECVAAARETGLADERFANGDVPTATIEKQHSEKASRAAFSYMLKRRRKHNMFGSAIVAQ